MKWKNNKTDDQAADGDLILGQYLSASDKIIGERTFDEKRYDTEVVRWLNKGKPIGKAIAKANDKFPAQALSLNAGNLAAVQAHYDYLAKHEAITRKLTNNG
ncbi:MAG: hypothetical protein Q8O90_06655 [Elusimicrobiota bacterium]|nr:hypothetical protein [Elusimicrobiota bacterium]